MRTLTSRILGAVVFAAGAFLTPAAYADAPLWLNIASPTNVQIVAPQPSGTRVLILKTVAAGDLDGSGYQSLAIQVSSTDPAETGVYVVFGAAIHEGQMINLENLGSDGYRISGADMAQDDGVQPIMDPGEIANVGDLSDDGLDDLAISFTSASHNGLTNSGSVYVVYGKTNDSPVDLDTLGDGGFRVDGPVATGGFGFGATLAPLVDAGPGGQPGILISSPGSNSVYGVYAQAPGSVLDLSQGLGDQAFEIEGPTGSASLGASCAGGCEGLADAGDQTGDGLDDVAMAAATGDWSSDAVYVVDNPGPGGVVDLDNPGAALFTLTVPAGVTRFFNSITNLGDLTGDGRDDLAVSSSSASTDGRSDNGVVWVVYSPVSGTVDLTQVAAAHQGFEIDGAASGIGLGSATANAGDQNGDGKDDLLVANQLSYNGQPPAYVVDTPPAGSVIDLANLPAGAGAEYGCVADASNEGGVVGCDGVLVWGIGELGDLNSDGIPAIFLSGPTTGIPQPDGSILWGASVLVVGSAPAPVPTPSPAQPISPSTAQLNDTVAESLSPGIPSSVQVSDCYQYGTTTTYGNSTAAQVQTVSTTPVTASAQVSGLHPGVLYHYRLVALNDRGELSYGRDQMFTLPTGQPPSRNPAPTGPGKGKPSPRAVLHVRVPRGSLTVTLDASASRAASGRYLTSFRWTVGHKIIGHAKKLRYTFARPGTYHVTLTVTDNHGARQSATTTVIVRRAHLRSG